MKYKVIKYFTDLQDNNHAYHAGDEFPREGLEVSEERIKELSTKKNRRKTALIVGVEEDGASDPPKDNLPEEGKDNNTK